MQPLKLRTGPTFPNRADAIALLRSIERYQPPSGQKQRVRMRILERLVHRRITILHPALTAGLATIVTERARARFAP